MLDSWIKLGHSSGKFHTFLPKNYSTSNSGLSESIVPWFTNNVHHFMQC